MASTVANVELPNGTPTCTAPAHVGVSFRISTYATLLAKNKHTAQLRAAGAFVQFLTPTKMVTPRLLPARWWFREDLLGSWGTPYCPQLEPARWKVQTPTKATSFVVAPAVPLGNSEWE